MNDSNPTKLIEANKVQTKANRYQKISQDRDKKVVNKAVKTAYQNR